MQIVFSGQNFLWVELHGNCTSQNMLESRSYMGTLDELHIAEHIFRENPQCT